MRNVRMKKISSLVFGCALVLLMGACGGDSASDSEFTGNEVTTELIPGTVEGNTTTGTLVIRERTDGKAQLEITLNNVISGAQHPVHLHFGSLDDDGEVATFLTTLTETNGVGRSVTVLSALDNDTSLDYSDLLTFNGSIKIHFEPSGPLENAVLGSTNVGLNVEGNEAYLNGTKDITTCNTIPGN